MSNVPVLQAVRAAEAFRRLHWRQAIGALTLVFLGNMAAVAGSAGQSAGRELLLQLITIPCSVVASGALLRLAFQDERPGDPDFFLGPWGLQWRKPEWRLLGVWALLGFLALLAAMFTVFLAVLFGATAALVGLRPGAEGGAGAVPPNVMVLATLVGLGLLLAYAYVLVRLMLAMPATVARRRVAVFETWPLTKGQFPPMLAAWLLVNIPCFLIALVLGGLVAAVIGNPDPSTASFGETLLIGLFPSLVAAYLLAPLNTGLAAYLYRGLRPPEEAPAARPY